MRKPFACTLLKSSALALLLSLAGHDLHAEMAQSSVINGMRIGVGVKALNDAKDRFRIEYTLTDAASGLPATGARIASWAIKSTSGVELNSEACNSEVSKLLNAGGMWKQETSLNAFRLLLISDEAVIRVVNPLASIGGSHLERVIPLAGVPEAWAASHDGKSLAVTLKGKPGISVVDMETMAVIHHVADGRNFGDAQLTFSNDHGTLWSSSVATGELLEIDTQSGLIRRTINVPGTGRMDITSSSDGDVLLVRRQGQARVELLRTRSNDDAQTIEFSQPVMAAAWSEAAQRFYGLGRDGSLRSMDDPGRTLAMAPHANSLSFSPDGRFGFLGDVSARNISVFDAAAGKMVGMVQLADASSKIIFSGKFAYLIADSGKAITLLDMSSLQAGSIVPVNVQLAAASPEAQGMPRSSAVVSPEGNAIFVADPSTKLLTYYVEGTMAPSGTLATAGASKIRDILLTDNGLRETEPGHYAAETSLRKGGHFLLPVVVDQPRAVHCFSIDVPGAGREAADEPGGITIAAVESAGNAEAGRMTSLRYRLLDASGQPVRGVNLPIDILAMEETGAWQRRSRAYTTADGEFALTLRFPAEGIYRVSFHAPALGLGWGRSAGANIMVKGAVQ